MAKTFSKQKVNGVDYLVKDIKAHEDIASLNERAEIIENTIMENVSYTPVFIHGSVYIPEGRFTPDDSVLNRIIEMEYISTEHFNALKPKTGHQYIAVYYNENKEYVSDSGNWSGETLTIDKTKAYIRVVVKKADNTDFESIPKGAVCFFTDKTNYITESRLNEINEAIFGTVYEEDIYNTNASSQVRWFYPITLNGGCIDSITIVGSGSSSISIEIWQDNNGLYTMQKTITASIVSGNNTIKLSEKLLEGTHISVTDSNGYIRCRNRGGSRSFILRDKSSTSFYGSSLEDNPASISGEIVWFGVNQENDYSDSVHTYYIGEDDNVAEIITDAMRYKGSVVYIEPYEHDCIAEWEAFYGDTYFSSMSTGRGLELRNDVHIIGRSGHKLKCYYTGDNDYVMENFSLFNNGSGGSGYTLENLCIDTKKIRYCIHDERATDAVPYKVRYSRCIMSQDMTGSTWDHSRACIGGGLGQHGDVLVEDCIFSTVTSEENMDSLAYHNSASENAISSIVIRGCYCTGDSTLQLASYGSSTKKTKVIVSSCSFGSPIEVYNWSGSDNMELYEIGNIIRE